ncbi:MAG TPA: polysaccharide deacetylase family protein [Candidatus Limnocylindria bacterium]|nr:polysaccharide deacetylase family protein [Candidatus Limnocylindria bacterium]
MPTIPSRLVVLLSCLSLLLAACAADPSPSGSATASPVVTPTVSMGEPSGSIVATPSGVPVETPAGTPSGSPSASPAVTTYVVQAGDNLYRIGLKFGASVEQLQAWNAERYPALASDPTVLQAGWELIVAGSPDVTPRPTPTQTAAPSVKPTAPPTTASCRAGNRVAAGSTQNFSSIPTGGKAMAITLDMGGRLDPALDILDYLIANKVCTTIFATGAMGQTATGQKILGVVRQHPELFEVGNHTMHHCDLVRGGGGSPTAAPCKTSVTGSPPTAAFIRKELTDAEAIIRQYAGQNPQPYWRPPYGSVNSAVANAAASVGYTKTLLWSIDTIDWKPISDGGPTAQQIAARVMAGAKDGWIVLDHIGGYETYEALKIMVPGLRKAGFTLTTISDLLH